MFLLQAAATAPFNWPTVIASVLGGGLISSIIAFFASRKLKEAEFNYDYRKYILEKRKKAYEQIESCINKLYYIKAYLKEYKLGQDKKGFSAIREVANEIDKEIVLHSMWLSPGLMLQLSSLVRVMNEVCRVVLESDNEVNSYEQYLKVSAEFQQLVFLYFYDIERLDDIKTFQKEVSNASMKELSNVYQEKKWAKKYNLY